MDITSNDIIFQYWYLYLIVLIIISELAYLFIASLNTKKYLEEAYNWVGLKLGAFLIGFVILFLAIETIQLFVNHGATVLYYLLIIVIVCLVIYIYFKLNYNLAMMVCKKPEIRRSKK